MVVRSAALMLACVTVAAAACSNTVAGAARVRPARDGKAPMVAPADLDKLLLSDAQVSELMGAAGLVTFESYAGIPPPVGEIYSDPSCAEAVWNTMWTAYNGTGYTGGAGRKVGEPADKHPLHTDQGVVSFPSADAATRFVVRAVLDWERCADTHLSSTEPPPDSSTSWYTVGFPRASDDVSTVVDSVEGGQGRTIAHAITSRSNVVIDVYAAGMAMTADKAVAMVNAIADKMPH